MSEPITNEQILSTVRVYADAVKEGREDEAREFLDLIAYALDRTSRFLFELRFEIKTRPRAWARAGHRKGGGKYNPNEGYQEQIRLSYMVANGGRRRSWTNRYSGAVAVEVDCYFRDAKKRGPMHGKRTDVDNLAKNVLDALNGLAYDDDGRVSDLRVRKFCAEEDLVVVRLRALQPTTKE